VYQAAYLQGLYRDTRLTEYKIFCRLYERVPTLWRTSKLED